MTYTIDDVNHLYLSIGEAIWNLQHLENVMTTYNALRILQKKREKKILFSDEQAFKILEKQRKLTLGPLISSAKDNHTLSKELEGRFENFLTERNWLIHKCVISDYLSLRNKESKEKLFLRITAFIEDAVSLKRELYNQMQRWFEGKGYDLEKAYALADELLDKSK